MIKSLINHHRLYRWLLLGLVAIILLSPIPYWLTGVGQSAPKLSAEIIHSADGALLSSPKAEARHSLTLPMNLERMVVYPLLLLAFQLSGGAVALRRWLESRIMRQAEPVSATPPPPGHKQSVLNRWLSRLASHHLVGRELLLILLFIVVFDLGLFLLYLPFNFYRSYIVDHQFGLSTLTLFGWLGDWVKSVLMAYSGPAFMRCCGFSPGAGPFRGARCCWLWALFLPC